MTVKQVRFTKEDRECLGNYFHLADTIADLIGPHCEVVVHSFESIENSIVKIVNGHHTGRDVGSPITDLGLKMWSEFEQTGELSPKSYFTNTPDGSLMKSTTSILLAANQKPIGMLCINMNLSFPFPEIIKTLLPQSNKPQSITSERFSTNASDVIEQALNTAIAEIESDTSISTKKRNKAIVRRLYENGVFEFKETTTQVSNQLKISRQAVYKFIREFKSK